jgi:hypothetical protein
MAYLFLYCPYEKFGNKKPHRNAAFVKNQSGSVTPKENELIILKQVFLLR